MRDLEEIVKDFVVEAGDDSVGFWRIVNAVRHESGKTAPEEIRPASLKVVEGLLNRGLEVVDYYEGRGWSKWPEQSTPAVLARIEREWNALGRDPNLGDIAWFRLPE